MIKVFIAAWILCLSGLASAHELSPVFGCASVEDTNKSSSSERRSKSDSNTLTLNKQLTKLSLGRNTECAIDAIVDLGDEKTARLLAERASSPSPQDEEGYAADVLRLLQTRGKTISNSDEFVEVMRSFRHPVSIEHFFRRHLQDLPFNSRLDVMSNIISQHSLQGEYAYTIPNLMERIYKENPEEYDAYILKMKEAPEEFTCFKNKRCP